MGISFGAVTADRDGKIYSVQSAAKRSKKPSLILACASLDDPGTIIYEHGKKFSDLWLSPAGHLHAASEDGFHHTNATGSWTKTRIAKDRLFTVWGSDDDHLLFGGNKGALFACRGRVVTPISTELNDDWISAFDASGPDDIYAVGRNGLAHFDGSQWRVKTYVVEGSRSRGADSVVCVSRDEVYLTDYTGLHRGNIRDGFRRIDDRKLQYMTRYQGDIVAAAYSGGIFRFRGDGRVDVLRDDISITYLNGNGRYLCVTGMAEMLHLFDGAQWTDKKF